MESHMANWQKVRDDWKRAYNKNEERYKDSMDLLTQLFQI